MNANVTLRVARPTDRLEEVVRFHTQGLGLTVIGSFADRDGFEGVMLGVPGAPYHFRVYAQAWALGRTRFLFRQSEPALRSAKERLAHIRQSTHRAFERQRPTDARALIARSAHHD
jgi:hypothetical protein